MLSCIVYCKTRDYIKHKTRLSVQSHHSTSVQYIVIVNNGTLVSIACPTLLYNTLTVRTIHTTLMLQWELDNKLYIFHALCFLLIQLFLCKMSVI